MCVCVWYTRHSIRMCTMQNFILFHHVQMRYHMMQQIQRAGSLPHPPVDVDDGDDGDDDGDDNDEDDNDDHDDDDR